MDIFPCLFVNSFENSLFKEHFLFHIHCVMSKNNDKRGEKITLTVMLKSQNQFIKVLL